MNIDVVRQYVMLRQRQKEREAEAGAIKEEADALEQEILDQFGESGLDSLRIDTPSGRRTVYLERKLWSKVEEGVDREAICHAFAEIGLEHFVTETFNSNTVSAWLRDLEREAETENKTLADLLPTELVGKLGWTEVYKVRDRKA